MSTLLFSIGTFLLFGTTIAEKRITVLNNCSRTQYLHYAYQDTAFEFVQSGSVPMENGDSYKPNFVETFGGYLWINNENCNPYNSATGCTLNYGTFALLQLSSETSYKVNSNYIFVYDSYGGYTTSMLIQSWPNATDCPEVYVHKLEDGTIIGANIPVDCPNGHSYLVTMCASDGN